MSFIKKISKKIVTLASLGIMSILPFNSEQVNQIAEKTLNQEKNQIKIVNQISLASTAFAEYSPEIPPEIERVFFETEYIINKYGRNTDYYSYKTYNDFLDRLYDPNAYKDLTKEERDRFYDELRIESDKKVYDILSNGIESFDQIIKNKEFTEELDPWFKDEYEKIFFEGLIGFDKNKENYYYKMNDYFVPVATGMHELKDVDEQKLEKIIEESRLNVAPLYYTQDMFPGDQKFLGFSNITFAESKEIAKENKVVFYLPSTEAFVVVKDDYSDRLRKRFEEMNLVNQIEQLGLDKHHEGIYAMNAKVYFEYFLPMVYNDISRANRFELETLRIMRVYPHDDGRDYYGKGVLLFENPYIRHSNRYYPSEIYDIYSNLEKAYVLFSIDPRLINGDEKSNLTNRMILRFESDNIESGLSTEYSFLFKLKDDDHLTLIYPDELYQYLPDAKVFLEQYYLGESDIVLNQVNEVTTGLEQYPEILRMNSWYNYNNLSYEDTFREFMKNKLIDLRLPGDTMGIIAIPDEMIIFEKDPIYLETDEKNDNLRQTWKEISMDLMNLLYFYEQNDYLELFGYSSKDLNQVTEDNFKVISEGLNFQPNYIYNPFFREIKARIFQAGIESSTGFLNPLLAVISAPSFAEQRITQEEDYPVMSKFNNIKTVEDLLDQLEYIRNEQNKNEITRSNPAYDLAAAALYKEILDNQYIIKYKMASNLEKVDSIFKTSKTEDEFRRKEEETYLRFRELSYSDFGSFNTIGFMSTLSIPFLRENDNIYYLSAFDNAANDAFYDRFFSELKDIQRIYPLPEKKDNETLAKFIYETYYDIADKEDKIVKRYLDYYHDLDRFISFVYPTSIDIASPEIMLESINAAYVKMLNYDSPFWQWYSERADKDQDAYAYQFIRAIDELTGDLNFLMNNVLITEAFIKNPQLITEYNISPKRIPNTLILAISQRPESAMIYETLLRGFLANDFALLPKYLFLDNDHVLIPKDFNDDVYKFNFRMENSTYYNLIESRSAEHPKKIVQETVVNYLSLSSQKYSKFINNNPLVNTRDNINYIVTPPILINDFYKNYYLNIYKTYPEEIRKDFLYRYINIKKQFKAEDPYETIQKIEQKYKQFIEK